MMPRITESPTLIARSDRLARDDMSGRLASFFAVKVQGGTRHKLHARQNGAAVGVDNQCFTDF